nr:penicillin-binding protein 1C [Sphingomonas sp. YR710]
MMIPPIAWLRRRPVGCLFALLLAIGIAGLWTRPPPIPDFAQTRADWRPSEAWLRDRNGRLLDATRVDYSVRRLDWVPLARIAPDVRTSVIAAEDKRFASHSGVDWIGLLGSAWGELRGRHARGASTLTMQLAGFLAPELGDPGTRGLRAKLRQMRAAQAIEARWSKDQILEAYLNLAAFRGETQGIGAAARALFGKAPDALDRNEALLLAALLPSPQADPAQVARRACRIGRIADCTTIAALADTMIAPETRLADDPGLAPHLAASLLRKPGETVKTTLDIHIQSLALTALRHQLLGLGADRARDGAVIVVDNASGDVLAYVGGAGGGSTASHVDNAAAPRQAGSSLKPFLYAQAIERGFITPASILDDAPIELDTASGLYVPKDYDHDFKGPVSARFALAGSLNVPAVRVLLLDGVEDFRDRLWDLGYRRLTEDGEYYGFSLALGPAEVTLLEQAAAYRALADGGRYRPLRIRADDKSVPPRPVIDPASAWITGDILSDAGARAGTFGIDSALRLPFWSAAKTGTSKAMRDNWCIGYSDRFIVAVWVGNAEGDSMRDVSGTSGAAPVWREIMLGLHRDRAGSPPLPPAGIERRLVHFASTIEPPRTEFFRAGTGQALVAQAPATARRPHIVSPVAGSVYALDPDIPIDHQKIRLAAIGVANGERLLLDRHDLGAADVDRSALPGPGVHSLTLVDRDGRTRDEVRFTVR